MKSSQISILAFEVANTIVKGANLMHSLSEENIKHLKELVLPSEAVQRLISNDWKELLRIAASDKRDELKVFSGEVVRFGNRCRDPQWHNLDRYFAKELYHELHAFDRFDQDYRRKLQEEENSGAAQKGINICALSNTVHFTGHGEACRCCPLHAFLKFMKPLEVQMETNLLWEPIIRGWSAAGLALHYANIINQIDTLVSRSGSLPPSMRDSLYQNLPPSIKSALRCKLQEFQLDEEVQNILIKITSKEVISPSLSEYIFLIKSMGILDCS
ncbi:hypothetical protein HPP92_019382 [Vanilla planifolia]|uniref:DUF3475 domain-containing protein n=1 Tax=Vanilla planifolia TaxID=51239 RepID=A0A835UJ44_VANPL|nr:hypothetical protein HPP92_019382 [Vanilla planifolia]